MPINMDYDESGMEVTQSDEGLRLHAYQDSGGVWTIGWGHTGPDVHEGLVWTRAQALAALREDLGE